MWQCRILFPWPGIKSVLPEEEEQNPNQWTIREVLACTPLSHAGKYSIFVTIPHIPLPSVFHNNNKKSKYSGSVAQKWDFKFKIKEMREFELLTRSGGWAWEKDTGGEYRYWLWQGKYQGTEKWCLHHSKTMKMEDRTWEGENCETVPNTSISTNFFYKRADSKYSRIWKSYGLFCNYFVVLMQEQLETLYKVNKHDCFPKHLYFENTTE